MANITFGKALKDWGWLEDFYDLDTLELASKSATKVVYKDGNGDQIVLTGTGFSFTGDFATKGKVTGADFIAGSGDKFLTFTKGDFKASDVFSEIKDKEFFGLLTRLTAGDDIITGRGSGEDIIIGDNAGDDKIFGKGGDDFIKGSAGDNSMNGGMGFDTLSYQDTYWDKTAKTGIVLDISKGTVKNSWGGTDKFKSFEEYRGSDKADKFIGSDRGDILMGLGGKDAFDGGKGFDEVRYNRDENYEGKKGIVADLEKGKIKDGFGSTDTVKNVEAVTGTYFNDTFKGNAKDNEFRGLSGKDSYDGGKGSDTVNFRFWEDLGQKGIVVDLRKAKDNILDDGFGNKETAKSIENIMGSEFDDSIKLGKADGWAWGHVGDDRVTAGSGKNWLGGDVGADTFIFLSAKHSTATKTDTIEDFSQKEGDRIDVSKAADFDFIGKKSFSGADNELNYAVRKGDTFISGDLDGDKKADFVVKLEGKFALVEGDFIL